MKQATLAALRAAHRAARPIVRALDTQTGEEVVIDPLTDNSPLGKAAAAALRADASGRLDLNGRRWFLSVYNSPWEIVAVGAVHITQALAAMAASAGYSIRIIDPRAAYATPERFPNITISHAWPNEALASQPLTPRSALLVLAHDPKLDDPALAAALRSSAGYIGALGSKRTHARRLLRLAELGFSEGETARIHAPVGLAIGARSPSEIAIAILAELVQVRRRPAPHIGGIVLAAGASSRMGHNKLVAVVKGKPLVRHAVEAALTATLDPVVVVTGHDPATVAAALEGLPVCLIHNGDYTKGLSTSLRAGLAALPQACEAATVLLGDMPDISPELIARLIKAFDLARGRSLCVATSQGRQGHPVVWGRQYFSEIAELTGDSGAKVILAKHASQVIEVEAGSAPLIDIDTPEALETYLAEAEVSAGPDQSNASTQICRSK